MRFSLTIAIGPPQYPVRKCPIPLLSRKGAIWIIPLHPVGARSQAVKYLEHPLNRKLDLFEFQELP
ncbi:hypothetical protein [Microcoleus sp. D3_18_C4]|uniref:hypothetical protein n=1 Tax=Microcoleus sp. D3_18_C4 TaxID=3055335 RepID=UPI002FCF31E1